MCVIARPRVEKVYRYFCDKGCPYADEQSDGWVLCAVDWMRRIGPDFVAECPYAKGESDEQGN